MRPITAIAAAAVVLLSMSGLAVAQAEKPRPAPPAPAPAMEKAPAMKSAGESAPRKRVRSRAMVDARHCLQLATNLEIHRCAEKYR